MNEKKTLRHFRTAMRVFLAVCMVALMVPAVALAADDVTETVSVYASAQDKSVVVGNVTVEEGAGVGVQAANGHSGSATTGSITAPYGAYIEANGSDSSANLTVNGEIQAKGEGLYAGAWNGATAKASVTGDITASNTNEDSFSEGLIVNSSSSGTATIEVVGNVTASNPNEYAAGAVVEAYPGGTSNLSIDGDVTSNGGGLYLSSAAGIVDVLVTGTINGKIASVVVRDSALLIDEPVLQADGSSDAPGSLAGSIVLTVWKIVLNKDGYAAVKTQPMIVPKADAMADSRYTQDKDFEKSIKYIIKVQQPKAGGKVSVTDASGNALDKSHGYEIAYEGDKVMLKVDLESGYKLLGAYNGEDEQLELLQDENGNYYIVVPKGGGVNLSVELGETTSDNGSDDPDNPNNPADDSDDEAAPTKVASEGSGLPKTADDTTGLLAVASIALAGAALMLAGAARSRKRQLQCGEHIR